MFALIDCNNFYAACERLFRPDLARRPIIVLSNNDGCVIARSNEAKALGIGMGEPYFKVKAICKKHSIAVFSSNYTLYGDLSNRVMSIIAEQWPNLEQYSIDEAFLDLQGMPPHAHTELCETLQRHILKCTGIPTSIGMGKTKTLAKAANHIAKQQLNIPVFNLSILPHWLDKVAIEDVWGVGKRWAVKLKQMHINTAGDLARCNPALIRKRFNVVMQRTTYELQGISCLNLNDIALKQSIVSSKSFGTPQTELSALEQAISAHMARAWTKMRAQGLAASYVSVFILSNRHRTDLAQYTNTAGLKMVMPCDDIRQLTQYAKQSLRKIFKPGIDYKKAGVLVDGLLPKATHQADLFHTVPEQERLHTDKLMNTIECINQRFGKSTMRLAAEGYAKPWAMRQELKSPAYTTQWRDLPIVHADSTDNRLKCKTKIKPDRF